MHWKQRKIAESYIIGVALGDGNLSNPNGRATRLRVTCDARYPLIQKEIMEKLSALFPQNKVSVINRTKTYKDISVYSNSLEQLLPWRVGYGSKLQQKARVPSWIKKQKSYAKACLRGLLHTDGSIYTDRGYVMVNFSNHSKELAQDTQMLIKVLGYAPTISETKKTSGNTKYTVRLARNTEAFITSMELEKS